MIKVLFLKEVENVAQPGELKDVRPGFARNYLLPQNLAVVATPATLKQHQKTIDLEKARLAKVDAEQRVFAGKLGEVTVTIKSKAGKEGRLYGSITAQDVAEAIQSQFGFDVDRRTVHLAEPIRRVGDYDVEIRLRRDLVPTIKVTVESDSVEASEEAAAS